MVKDSYLEVRQKYQTHRNPLYRNKYGDVDSFTSDFGIKIRRLYSKPLRALFKLGLKLETKKDIIVHATHDNYDALYSKDDDMKEAVKRRVRKEEIADKENIYPNFEKDKPYIFAVTHGFVEDIAAAVTSIDRPAYILIGSNDQLENNFDMKVAWLNGLIALDLNSPTSRKESLGKMKRIINSGTSVVLFPEGSYNQSENKIIKPLYSGVYNLAKATGAEVVPVGTFHTPKMDSSKKYLKDEGSNNIYVSFGCPIKLADFETKDEAVNYLRDEMARLQLNHFLNYTNSLKRSDLNFDTKQAWMEINEELVHQMEWSDDTNWDEEYQTRVTKEEQAQIYAFSYMDQFNQGLTFNMACKEKQKRMEKEKYNYIDYLYNSTKYKSKESKTLVKIYE